MTRKNSTYEEGHLWRGMFWKQSFRTPLAGLPCQRCSKELLSNKCRKLQNQNLRKSLTGQRRSDEHNRVRSVGTAELKLHLIINNIFHRSGAAELQVTAYLWAEAELWKRREGTDQEPTWSNSTSRPKHQLGKENRKDLTSHRTFWANAKLLNLNFRLSIRIVCKRNSWTVKYNKLSHTVRKRNETTIFLLREIKWNFF